MKRFVIILSIIAIIVGIFSYQALFGKKAPDVTTQVEDVAVEGVGSSHDRDPIIGNGTLLSLKALQKNLECQIMYTANDGKDIEGTYFVSGGKIRGDFIVPAPEFSGQIISSLIMDDPIMYVWSKIGDDTYGYKIDKSDPAEDNRVDSKEPVPLDVDVRYSCTVWEVVDGSIFVPPSGVEFKEVNTAIKAGMEYGNQE